MDEEPARCHVSNFNGAVNVNYNKTMALELFDLIQANTNTVSEQMGRLAEKIETQFMHMGVIR